MALSQHKPKRTKSAQAQLDRRNALIERAQRGSAFARRKLAEEFNGLKIYTPQERDAFVRERPDLLDPTLKGKTYFDAKQANN